MRLRISVGVVVAIVVAAGAPMNATPLDRTTADEPHYLLTAISLWEDRDLDVADERAARRYLPFHGDVLPMQATIGPGGRQVAPHDPLLPLVLAVPTGLGGWLAAKLTLAVLAGALAVATLELAIRRFGVRRHVAAVAAVIAGASPPLAVYGTQVYPELAAALVTVLGVCAATGSRRTASLAASGAAVVALPWLSVKYAPVAAVIAVVVATGLARAARLRALTGWCGALGLAALAYVWAHQVWYGGWTAYASGSHFGGDDLAVMGADPDYWSRGVRLLGLLVDRTFGLLPWQPAAVIAIPAVVALLRRRPPGAVALVAVAAAGWLNATFVALTMHGWWWPGRQVVVVVPLLVVAVAWFADRLPARGRVAVAIAGAAGVLAFGFLVWEVLAGDRSLVVDLDRLRNPVALALRPLLPDLRRWDAADRVRFWSWALGAAALAVWGWRSARRPAMTR